MSLTSGYVRSDILSRFRRAWPNMEVSAVADTAEYLEYLLLGGGLDVAVLVVSSLKKPASCSVNVETANRSDGKTNKGRVQAYRRASENRWAMGRANRLNSIVVQDTLCCSIGVVELPGAQTPQKGRKTYGAQQERDGDKNNELVHANAPFSPKECSRG